MAHRLRVPAHFGIRGERYKLIFFYGCDQQGKNQTPTALGVLRLGKKIPTRCKTSTRIPVTQRSLRKWKIELKKTREDLDETDAKYPAIQKIIDAHW